VAKTNAEFWAEKIRTNRTRDARTNQLLTDAGWQVVRVWEHENPQAAAAHVADVVRARLTPPR